MNFIKVGKSFLNLDNVNEVRPGILGSLDVFFGGLATDGNTLEYNVTNFDGAEGEALLAWLDSVSIDVVEQLRRGEEEALLSQAKDKLYALGFAHGTAYSDQVQPSFPGTRANVARNLAHTDSVYAEYLTHCTHCGIEPGEFTLAAWRDSFVSGLLSQ